MLYRRMNSDDMAGIVTLWRSVFFDDEAFIKSCIHSFATPKNVFVAQQDNEIVAHLLAVECLLKGQRGAYVYALATRADMRGQGVMQCLMDFAQSELVASGVCFFVLQPATEELFAYYERGGYTHRLALCRMNFPPFQLGANTDALFNDDIEYVFSQVPTAQKLHTLRSRFLDVPYVEFLGSAARLVAEDISQQGVRLCASQGAYALYKCENGVLCVQEMGAQDAKVAKHLLQSLCAETKCARVSISIAQHSALCESFVAHSTSCSVEQNAMLKPFGDFIMPKGTYLRFALE